MRSILFGSLILLLEENEIRIPIKNNDKQLASVREAAKKVFFFLVARPLRGEGGLKPGH